MFLGYVCTNYNNSFVTHGAVSTLTNNIGHEIEIAVVDNASDFADVQNLRSLAGPHVEIIESPKNLGYFPGLNAGIRRLREKHPNLDWIVVGNNDLEFPPDFCDKLQVIQADLSKYSVISPDIITMDGEHQNPHVIKSISKKREFVYDLYYSNYFLGLAIRWAARQLQRATERGDEREWRTAQEVHQGYGAVYILTPRFFDQFDELWAPTFMMSEEYFLSKQLLDVGEMTYYTPQVTVRHLTHATMDQLPNRKRWELARDAHRVYREYIKVF